MHLGIVLASLSKNIYHFPNRILGIVRPFHNLYNCLVSCLTFLQVCFGDKDVIGQRAVLSKQVCIVPAYLQGSHKLFIAAFQDFCNSRLANMVLTACQHGYLNLIAIHSVHTVTLCNQNGFTAILRLKGILAISFTVEDSLHHLGGGVQHVAETGLFLNVIVHHQNLQHIH